MAAWMGFNGAIRGLLDGIELNWVVHWSDGVVREKQAAVRAAGVAVDLSARRDAPLRSMAIAMGKEEVLKRRPRLSIKGSSVRTRY